MNKYHQHIKNLCRRHSITLLTGERYHTYIIACKNAIGDSGFQQLVTPKNSAPSFSLVDSRLIAVPKINNKFSYFNALHEIGHVLCDERETGEDGQLMAAFNLGKVTKYILKCECRASSFAFKSNKYATTAYLWKLASFNQLAYIAKYESDWKTKLKPPFRFHYLSFSKNKNP
jgi:hypothetical protein